MNDGHAGNFALFNNSTPKFFDLGSIIEIKNPHHALDEFCRYFMHPLILASKGKNLGRLTRLLCQYGGIGFKESHDLLDFRFEYPSNRKETLLFLQSIIENLSLDTPDSTLWKDYRNITDLKAAATKLIEGETHAPRNATILDLLRKIKPHSVADIGCNDGFFSTVSAMLGAKVLALDTDAGAIRKLIFNLKNNSHDLTITAGIKQAEILNLSEKK